MPTRLLRPHAATDRIPTAEGVLPSLNQALPNHISRLPAIAERVVNDPLVELALRNRVHAGAVGPAFCPARFDVCVGPSSVVVADDGHTVIDGSGRSPAWQVACIDVDNDGYIVVVD